MQFLDDRVSVYRFTFNPQPRISFLQSRKNQMTPLALEGFDTMHHVAAAASISSWSLHSTVSLQFSSSHTGLSGRPQWARGHLCSKWMMNKEWKRSRTVADCYSWSTKLSIFSNLFCLQLALAEGEDSEEVNGSAVVPWRPFPWPRAFIRHAAQHSTHCCSQPPHWGQTSACTSGRCQRDSWRTPQTWVEDRTDG